MHPNQRAAVPQQDCRLPGRVQSSQQGQGLKIRAARPRNFFVKKLETVDRRHGGIHHTTLKKSLERRWNTKNIYININNNKQVKRERKTNDPKKEITDKTTSFYWPEASPVSYPVKKQNIGSRDKSHWCCFHGPSRKHVKTRLNTFVINILTQ